MTTKNDYRNTYIPTHCRLLDGVGPTESELSYFNLSRELGKSFIKAIRVRKEEHRVKRHFKIINAKL